MGMRLRAMLCASALAAAPLALSAPAATAAPAPATAPVTATAGPGGNRWSALTFGTALCRHGHHYKIIYAGNVVKAAILCYNLDPGHGYWRFDRWLRPPS